MLRRIERNLKALVPKDTSEPLVIKRSICDQLTAEVIAVGEGRRILPYNQIIIQILVASEKERNIYEASLIANNELERSIREHLCEEGCQSNEDLEIIIELTEKRSEGWGKENFNLILSRKNKEPSDISSAHLRLMTGTARNRNYRINKSKYYIGRLAVVIDRHGFPVRRNDLIFTDRKDETNSSVSRAHAMIEFDDETQNFILRDTNSRHGTKVERDGRLIEVTGPRGIRLRDGDKLFFGKACVYFSVSSDHS